VKDRIILFLKNFRAGRVKTRLAAHLGAEGALAVYTSMVSGLLERLAPLRDMLVPYIDALPSGEDPAFGVLRTLPGMRLQHGKDLGERMSNAFQEVFASGADRAVLIGSDIPRINRELLEGYLASLRSYPMTIGPTADGGYYLIGFRAERFDPSVFRGIDWSTDRVFTQTLDRARSLRLDSRIGKRLRDIDTVEDLEAFVDSEPRAHPLARVLERYRPGTRTSERRC